ATACGRCCGCSSSGDGIIRFHLGRQARDDRSRRVGLRASVRCYKPRRRSRRLSLPTIFILNGPNLNLLGVRQPAIYGYDTLADVEQRCLARAKALDLTIEFRQSNYEGQIVDWIQEARDAADGIVLNAGALTHTSVAILDALNAAELP